MASVDTSEDLIAFYDDLRGAEVQALWQQRGLLPSTPPLRMRPWIWRSAVLAELCERALQLVGVDRGGDRRVLALAHPDLDGKPFATHTLWGAVQILGPGEAAPPHRHTPGALRFVMQGSGVWTAINGDRVRMTPGDVILTPTMCWHEHRNIGDESMLWFDGLDLPLVHSLDAVFFEPGGGADTSTRYERTNAEQVYATAGIVPTDRTPSRAYSALPVYRWENTDRLLTTLLDEDRRRPAVTVRFTDPTSGRDVMATMRASMTRIRAGGQTGSTRAVGSSIYVVYRGTGTSTISGTAIPWSNGDIFVVPSWATLSHEAAEGADLFVLSDAPVLEALYLDRHQVLSEPVVLSAPVVSGPNGE